jgi:3-phenylpropionate/trans-cinnamate dioxygenase ferredoxin reductase subunit
VTSPGVLIVGGGQAGLQTAMTLRDLDYPHEITIANSEDSLPYRRPPLSKGFLTGKTTRDELLIRPEKYLQDRRIESVRRERIAYVSLDEGKALAVSGREFLFQHLVLATGTRPRRLGVSGEDVEGVVHLNDLSSGTTLCSRLAPAHHVVVVGGGLVGLEAAASCRTLGKSVTLVEAADCLMARAASPLVREFIFQTHVQHGVTVRLDTKVVRIEGDGKSGVHSVVLNDGTTVPADVVVVGVGVDPRIELATQLQLQIHDGAIVVDRFATTSDPRVFAVGDCAIGPNQLGNGGLQRAPSVQNAVDQGRVAAHGITNTPMPPALLVSSFWTDQYDLKTETVGIAPDSGDYVVRGQVSAAGFGVFHYHEGTVVAAEFVNRPGDFMATKKFFFLRGRVSRDAFEDTSRPLKESFLTAAAAD